MNCRSSREIWAKLASFPYHKEVCVDKLLYSNRDIQIKRINGFILIDCFGHKIFLDVEKECADYLFELAATDFFSLNGHINQASNRKGVLIDPHELIINRELFARLHLDKVKIKTQNFTTLNDKLEALKDSVRQYGKSISSTTLADSDWTAPIRAVLALLSSFWDYLQTFLMVALAIGAACLLVVVSPAVHLLTAVAMTVVKFVKRTTTHSLKTSIPMTSRQNRS